MAAARAQLQLFGYAGIFSNRASKGYTQGSGVKWQCSVLPVCLQKLSLQAAEVNDGWKQLGEEPFPLIVKS